MDSKQRSLLDAICSEPKDDLPRLTYADWLEHEGLNPDRATFIRMQCELANLGEHPRGRTKISRKREIEEALATLYATSPTLAGELNAELEQLNPSSNYSRDEPPGVVIFRIEERETIEEQVRMLSRRFSRGFREFHTLSTYNNGFRAEFREATDRMNNSMQPISKLRITAPNNASYQPDASDIARIQLPGLRDLGINVMANNLHLYSHANNLTSVQTLEIDYLPNWFDHQYMYDFCDGAVIRPHKIVFDFARGFEPDVLRCLIASDMAKNAIIDIIAPSQEIRSGFSNQLVTALDLHNREAARLSGERYVPRTWMRPFLPHAQHRGVNLAESHTGRA